MPLVQIADGVWRCGTAFVNWYLVVDDGGVTVVDAGLPRYRPQLDEALRVAGRSLADVTAIVLTHADGDHTGFAEAVRAQTGAPVYVHAAAAEQARTAGRKKTEAGLLPYLRHGAAWALLGHFVRNGMPRKISDVSTFEDGAELDVPGRPRAIETPGHSHGHCALHFAGAGALLAGDAMCSRDPLTGARGPRLMPRALNVSSAQSYGALARLETVDAAVTGFGHGDPWRDSPAAAVTAARAAPAN
jgi:glyoxylase-like metal-dependent hydrolase (beta-lactamase superfamily II)